tara:strand:+ start:1459 stop:1833 length:375 start_codon:yes stop_codon:yes gene_type:complete
MKYDIPAALQALKPGAEWVLRGSEWSGLEWLDSKQAVPTEKEVTDKIAEMDAAEGMRLLRVERDAKLAALDWEVVKAYSNGEAVDSKLKTYMQALRDLPASASPKTDDFGELIADSITWPTRAS